MNFNELHEMEEQNSLILAAEECDPITFGKIHTFTSYEKKIIRSLVAHGPVLIRGGRGSGKSALLIEADRLLSESSTVLGIYLSLRYLPLLRNSGAAYEKIFCSLVSEELFKKLSVLKFDSHSYQTPVDAGQLRNLLLEVATKLQRRIVLIFDDAAHVGREKALTEFFDIFRTISGSFVSCKAAIYPGVTNFGTRFDVFNDATVIDVSRDERSAEFAIFFEQVLDSRFPVLSTKLSNGSVNKKDIAAFLGRTVVGNMRAFVFACNFLAEEVRFGLPELKAVLLKLASEYYWPLLDEVAPKLGKYEPLVGPCAYMAEQLFSHVGSANSQSVIIHRELVQKYAKLFEIQEYVGFVSRREASRAMKSGGRGPRYSLCLANLLEKTPKAQLNMDFFNAWKESSLDAAEIHSSSTALRIDIPELDDNADLGVYDLKLDALAKSNIYPYGLPQGKLEILMSAGYIKIRDVMNASDEEIIEIEGIGRKTLIRLRSVINQAIWM